jgi:hypothetical protein
MTSCLSNEWRINFRQFLPELVLDLLQNLIRLLKLPFLASLSTNFSTICLHIISKFVDKSAQKLSIFPAKAGYARGLFLYVETDAPTHCCRSNSRWKDDMLHTGS